MGSDRAKFCDLCEQSIKPCGWVTHQKACEKNSQKRAQDQHIADSIRQRKAGLLGPGSNGTAVNVVVGHSLNPQLKTQVQRDPSASSFHDVDNPGPYFDEQLAIPDDDRDLQYCEYQLDDIKVEHHPKSGIPTKIFAFSDFMHHPAHHSSWSAPEPNAKPWCPFRSHLEFNIAEIALKVALNNEQTDCLIDICCCCAVQSEKFMFKNHKDICAKWDAVSQRLTWFTKDVISIPFTDKTWDFDIYYRDLWEWATDLLCDPHLFPYFHFDAQCLAKFNSQSFERFVDKPFTAQDFWDAQLQLLHSIKPLAFILYTDKTKLSMNLPTHICNSQGMGGGYIVGWLPVVKEDKAHAGLLAWANFKATVWHKSFERILSSLTAKSKTGQWLECLDIVQHWFFLLILILSSNFEEQSTMVLTCGVRALWPCPVCLVPHDKLSDMLHCYPWHTSRDSEAILATTRERETAEEREEVLKDYGLHDVVKMSQVDKSYQAFPHWQDQKHPNQVMNILFTDNSMHEDILKVLNFFHSTSHLLKYHYQMIQYINKTVKSDKNWNFPKLHMGSHIFDDVEAKGATRNYNTKLNEKMHGSLKDLYLLHMNFHDIAEQVAADHICHCLFKFDDHQRQFDEEDLLEEEDFLATVVEHPVLMSNSFHMKLGLKQPPLTFDVIQMAHQADQAFINFCVKLNDFLNITEHRFIRINYELMVNWHQNTDYLHSNPHFFGSPHFDCIFIRLTENKVIFGQLVFCFECLVGNNTFPLALVHPFDVPTGLRTRKDKDLNLYRVHARPQAQAQFFPVRSFICRALLIADGPSDDLIVDTADTDMFLCIKMMHLEAGHIVCI
ncbi:uncharacterized protein BJ212DRAFT_1566538 [Suillus subaureus]|uniref:Uncharacterized protein n=1 Tax=Suillus subaureus TaxID=48587 RepID=A0A9P7EJ21_9AGAM|nr:uncharacterized protein BJ212DRAFT_1566538 [Suillus subaureus]KAG1823449.1 hypothetical protein BJ212DRAFT_1566538 [Suillus subaureus]